MTAIAPSSPFYIAGGTLPREASSYITRQADADLYAGLASGEYCYVLNSRQMGKSSLCVRTIGRLKEQGVSTAFLDLTRFGGKNLTAEQWYAAMLAEIGREVGLRTEVLAYWKANTHLGPMQRLFGALREVVLERIEGSVVVLVDESDVVRSLPFSTDEFFAAIRECYNRRVHEPEYARLTFCLIGVATPTELISDQLTTPFNIGRRVELKDFTYPEGSSLAAGLQAMLEREDVAQEFEPAASTSTSISRQTRQAFRRIFYWTSGHPYLTQMLFKAVSEAPPDSAARTARGRGRGTPDAVDRLCHELFLSPRARQSDDNLAFVRSHLLNSGEDVAALLELYAKVLRRKRILDDPANPLIERLKLAGLVRAEKGRLRARNRIYQQVFDHNWVRENMPGAEVRRQRRAFRKGIRLTFSVLGGLAALCLAGYGLWRYSLDVNPDIAIPEPAEILVRNAYRDFDAASHSLSNLGQNTEAFAGYKTDPKNKQGVDYTPVEAEDLVRKNAGALLTFRSGLQFAYQDPQERAPGPLSPETQSYFSRIRGLARLLRVEGMVQERKGKSGVSSYLDAIDLGGHLQHSSTVIGRQVGIACQAIGRSSLWKAVDRLDAPQARIAARRLEAITAQEPPLAETMLIEEWGDLASLRDLFQKPDWRTKMVTPPKMPPMPKTDPLLTLILEQEEPDEGRINRLRWSLWPASKRESMANYKQYLDAEIARVSQPYAAHPPPSPKPKDPVCVIKLDTDSPGSMFSAGPDLTRRIWCSDVGSHTYNTMLAATLALHAYKMEQKAYPAFLEQLVQAGILTRVPMDPYALNAPLHYRRQGNGYALYSVGPDGKDDNGSPLISASPSFTFENKPTIKRIEIPLEPDTKGDIIMEAQK